MTGGVPAAAPLTAARDDDRQPGASPSEAERSLDRDHRRGGGGDGVEDLGGVDALQVDRRDPEIRVAELALDDDQRDTFTGHLDGMCVAKLMWRESTAHTCSSRGLTQLGAGGSRRPRASARRSGGDAQQRTDRELDARGEPGLQLLPGPVVHADLAATAPLPRRTSTEPPRASKSASPSASASWMRSPARHSTM